MLFDHSVLKTPGKSSDWPGLGHMPHLGPITVVSEVGSDPIGPHSLCSRAVFPK